MGDLVRVALPDLQPLGVLDTLREREVDGERVGVGQEVEDWEVVRV